MACFKPVKAYKAIGGGVTFKKSESTLHYGCEMNLPCGRCVGCRLDRSRQWAIRCMHEAQLHQDNDYITLTYNTESLPDHRSLKKNHFQRFMKRLRRQLVDKKVRYYMCGEYGEALGRPHYHALLFGYTFPDKKLHKVLRGNPLYVSEMLDRTWGLGHCYIGAVTFKSAAYVARYIMKKQTGDAAERHYTRVDEETGEVHPIIPEYNAMSLRPGIGADWFEEYYPDVFPDDFVVMDGKQHKTPRYYDKLYKRREGEDALLLVKDRREAAMRARMDEQTPERLAVREKVAESKLKLLKRSLDET